MSSSERMTSRWQPYLPWLVVGFLLLAIAIVYGQTLGFGFLGYDDPAYVFDSAPVRGGLTRDSVVWAFTSGPFGEWYPLTMISHMVDCDLFGVGPPGEGQWGAGGHHLTNVLLHAATTIALFLVLWSMSGELWPSAFVAAVFAVHPQHVESVVWIAERRDVLSGLFFVLILAAYLGYVRHGCSVWRYLVVALTLSLGLMAKPILVTVPALLVVLDFWPLARFGHAADLPGGMPVGAGRSFWWLVIEKLPLFAISLAVVAITMATHGKEPGSITHSGMTRLANALVTLVRYLSQFFYPVDLAIFYPFPSAGYPFWQLAGAVVILGAITEAATSWKRQRPYLLVGWLWFIGMLTPVLGVVQVSRQAMADRYMYLPMIGLSIALAWGVSRLTGRLAVPRWTVPAAAAVAIVLLTLCAARQTALSRDEEMLWRHALATTEDNGEAELGLADVLRRAGRLDEALERYRRAAALETTYPLFNNMGLTLLEQGKAEEAAAQFRLALQYKPDSATTHDNLGVALLRQNDLDQASDELLRAIKLNPSYALAWYHLALLLQTKGDLDQALIHYQHALELNPGLLPAHKAVAALLAARGQIDEAIARYRAVLRIYPGDAEAQAALEKLLGGTGDAGQP